MPLIDAKDLTKYSLSRAIAGLGSGRPLDSFELDISQEISRKLKRQSAGLLVPSNLPAVAGERATSGTAYGATINAGQGGSNLVATNLLAGSFIDVLRNKTRIMQMGAMMLPGLVGNVQIPRQTSQTAAYWIQEGTDVTEAEAAFDSITMTPRTVAARSQFTRQFLLQASPAAEQLLRTDLAKTIAVAIDAAAIAGTGSNGQPTGIINAAGVNSIALGTNGAAATIDNLIDMETAIATASADGDTLAYLANAKFIGAARKLKDTTGRYLWSNYEGLEQPGSIGPAGFLNGMPAYRSNQVPSNLTKGTGTNLSAIVFGNWSDLIIGEWGVLEVLPNPYGAGFASGSVDIRAALSCSIAVRHPQSFAVITDAIA